MTNYFTSPRLTLKEEYVAKNKWIQDFKNIKPFVLSKERFLELIDKHYAKDSKAAVRTMKQAGIKGAFSSERWDEYMIAFSGVPGCALCGAPKKIQKDVYGKRYLCSENTYHQSAVDALGLMMNSTHCELSEEDAMKVVNGTFCSHGNAEISCNICRMEKYKAGKIQAGA